jgi:hypothetical protein
MDLRALPRSLDTLSGESLSGYILRLAHRLECLPGRLAQITELPRLTRPEERHLR